MTYFSYGVTWSCSSSGGVSKSSKFSRLILAFLGDRLGKLIAIHVGFYLGARMSFLFGFSLSISCESIGTR